MKMKMTREVTNAILDYLKQDILDKDTVLLACLNYMSEDDVRDMAEAEGFLPTAWDYGF